MLNKILAILKRLQSVWAIIFAVIAGVSVIYYLIITDYYKNIWSDFIVIYIFLASITFLPTLKAIFKRVKLNPGGDSFEESTYFSEDEKRLLIQHYTRIKGTLVFWKNQAEKYKSFHYYCLFGLYLLQ